MDISIILWINHQQTVSISNVLLSVRPNTADYKKEGKKKKRH